MARFTGIRVTGRHTDRQTDRQELKNEDWTVLADFLANSFFGLRPSSGVQSDLSDSDVAIYSGDDVMYSKVLVYS